MKANYLHIKHHHIPLYRGYLVIVLSNSNELIKKRLDIYEKEFDDALYAHTFLSDYKGKQGFFILLNFDHQQRDIFPGTIAHEACHVAMMIAQYRGFKESLENDEPIAYLIEWIVDRIYDYIYRSGFNITQP